MNELTKVFTYQENEVRTIIKDGEPWFVAKDVCDILDISNHRDTATRLDDDEKDAVGIPDAMGRSQLTSIVNEYGLYSLVMQSRKQEAKKFKRWITHEVLPSIRKHGMYAVDELLNDPDLAIKAFTALKEERAARLQAESKVNELAPKAEFADAMNNNKGLVLVRDYVKVLANKGFKIKQRDLFEWFLCRQYLYYERGSYKAKSRYIQQGLFRMVETPVKTHTGSFISYTTKITGKGQQYFYEKLKEDMLCRTR